MRGRDKTEARLYWVMRQAHRASPGYEWETEQLVRRLGTTTDSLHTILRRLIKRKEVKRVGQQKAVRFVWIGSKED